MEPKEYYKKQLFTDVYKARRKKFINYCILKKKYYCVFCHSKKNLIVSHPVYFRGRKVWNYRNSELEILCKECHAAIHLK
jgi:5-methylcytosine-specific restriction endonuclease McrA